MAFTPTVLSPLTLPGLLNYILAPQSRTAHTTLIICSDREAFLQALLLSLQAQDGGEADTLQHMIVPTLHNLATARHVNVAFCTSVQALAAYLTTYSGPAAELTTGKREEEETLMLVNPLHLHAPTPSFSAQGLSRTFATAIECALRVGAQLVLVECVGMHGETRPHDDEDDVEEAIGSRDSSPAEANEDPWEQEVPMLNASIRRFGASSSDRSWAGRTVKIKRVAGRWFRFYHTADGNG